MNQKELDYLLEVGAYNEDINTPLVISRWLSHDIAAVAEDADEEERKTVGHKRFVNTAWMPFKVLIALGFGLTAIAELWVIWS